MAADYDFFKAGLTQEGFHMSPEWLSVVIKTCFIGAHSRGLSTGKQDGCLL